MIVQGDCLEVLKTLEDNSVDSIVTDPPYGTESVDVKLFRDRDGETRIENVWKDFGSKEHARNATETAHVMRKKNIAFYDFTLRWSTEAFRVLKPGGLLISMSAARTYHRMASAVEDAGFEIRDMGEWLYGTGYPKSKDLLKPAQEPFVIARKPPTESSIKKNIERWGVGGLFIDSCRIGEDARYPTNILLDDYAAEQLADQHSSAPLFFYCAKPNNAERLGNKHPTVKPTDLMAWLCRLVTPPGGVVLDPFAGSGSTLVAAKREGFRYIGIEMEEQYIEIINKRLEGEKR